MEYYNNEILSLSLSELLRHDVGRKAIKKRAELEGDSGAPKSLIGFLVISVLL